MKNIIFLLVLIYVKSFSQNSSIEWAGKIGGNYNDGLLDLHIDSSGNLLTTGYFQVNADLDFGTGGYTLTGVSGFDAFVAKYNNDGNILWGVKFAGTLDSFGFRINSDSQGNVYSAGKFFNTIDFNPGPGVYNLTATVGPYAISDIYISKLDSNGNFVYAKKIGGLGVKDISDLKVDDLGNTYITGYFNKQTFFSDSVSLIPFVGQDTIYDTFIAKYDTDGNLIWVKQIGSGSILQRSESLAIDSLGNLLVLGTFHEVTDFNPDSIETHILSPHLQGATDIYILKLDSSGNFIWVKNIWGNASNSAKSITLDTDDNLLMTGFFSGTVDFDPSSNTYLLTCPPNSGYNPFILKLSSSGDFIWAKHLIGNGEGKGITVSPNGNIGITGRFNNTCDFSLGNGTAVNTTIGNSDIFIAEYSNSGDFNWVKCIGGTQDDIGLDIVSNHEGTYYSIANFFGNCYSYNSSDNLNLVATGYQDAMLLKISQNSLNSYSFNQNTFTVFPNPAQDKLFIELPKSFDEFQISVFSISGQLVLRTYSKTEINIDELSSGVYFIEVTNNSSDRFFKKIVKL